MTPAQASELLTDVLASKRGGASWRQLALVHGYPSPAAMKKAAKEAARVSQAFLLSSYPGSPQPGTPEWPDGLS